MGVGTGAGAPVELVSGGIARGVYATRSSARVHRVLADAETYPGAES